MTRGGKVDQGSGWVDEADQLVVGGVARVGHGVLALEDVRRDPIRRARPNLLEPLEPPAARHRVRVARAQEDADAVPEELDDQQKYEMRYEDDGVKPHTRTVRGAGTSPSRMVPVETPAKNKSAAVHDGNAPGSSQKFGSKTGVQDDAPKQQRASAYTLPPKWEVKNSASMAREYYYNTETGESAWRHPGTPTDTPRVLLLPPESCEQRKHSAGSDAFALNLMQVHRLMLPRTIGK